MIEKVKPGLPPVTTSAAEYAVPTFALPAAQGPQSRLIGDGATTMVQLAVSQFPFLSTTLDVKLYVPGVVGDPVMAPVKC